MWIAWERVKTFGFFVDFIINDPLVKPYSRRCISRVYLIQSMDQWSEWSQNQKHIWSVTFDQLHLAVLILLQITISWISSTSKTIGQAICLRVWLIYFSIHQVQAKEKYHVLYFESEEIKTWKALHCNISVAWQRDNFKADQVKIQTKNI